MTTVITQNVSFVMFYLFRVVSSDAVQESAVKKRKNVAYEFGNFSSW